MSIIDSFSMRDPSRFTRNRLLVRTGAPAVEPLTLGEAKAFLRVDGTDDDMLIADLIVAVRMLAEGWLRRSLIGQSWQLAFDGGVPETVWLPMGPAIAIAGVTVVGRDGSTVGI